MPHQTAFRIAWAQPEDALRLVPLMLAVYQHDVPEAPVPAQDAVVDHITRLLAPDVPHKLVIAWARDGSAAGLAAVARFCAISDPRPDRRVQVELKELFVLPEHRSTGAGQSLMDWIETFARTAGACRIDWHVKRDNLRGIAFYERGGAHVVANRLSMRKTLSP